MKTMRAFLAAAVLIAVAAPAARAQTKPAPKAPDTDRTVTVSRGSRLQVNNFAGEVVIRTWDRDSVRVAARHSSRSRVDVRAETATVLVSSSSSSGVASVDYEITAPAWMPIKVDGTYNFVSIEGTQGEVAATTVRGDINVKGGSGFVTVKSIEGEVVVDGARGRIHAESVNEGIRITGSTGDIVAETTNGDITLTAIEAQSVEASTVNGDVSLEGRLTGSRYRVATHNGDITLAIPETSSATFNVRTYNGDFRTSLPLKGAVPADARRGRRATFTLGSGSAEVELESFGGDIRIQRPGEGPGKTKAK